MQNYALKTRMLEYIDTIEKLRSDVVESQVTIKSKDELRRADNVRSDTIIDELRKEVSTLKRRATSLTPITLQLNKLTVPMCLNPMR